MEEGDGRGREMGMPDLPRDTQRERVGDSSQQEGSQSLYRPPGCGEKQGETSRMSLFRLPPKEQGG